MNFNEYVLSKEGQWHAILTKAGNITVWELRQTWEKISFKIDFIAK